MNKWILQLENVFGDELIESKRKESLYKKQMDELK